MFLPPHKFRFVGQNFGREAPKIFGAEGAFLEKFGVFSLRKGNFEPN